jgi:hypothetical protein
MGAQPNSSPSRKSIPPPPPAQKPKTPSYIPAPQKKSTDAAGKGSAANPKDAKASKDGNDGVKPGQDEELSDEELDAYYLGMF